MMTTSANDTSQQPKINPNLVLETVCRMLTLDTAEIVGMPRIASNAKLALACIAEIMQRRLGMRTTQISVHLKLPTHKVQAATESLNEGLLDTVAAHWEYKSALHFLAECNHEISRSMTRQEAA